MTIEISYGAVGAGCAVLGLLGKIVHGLLSGALEARDLRIKQVEAKAKEDLAALEKSQDVALKAIEARADAAISGARANITTLFGRYDTVTRELQEYKLYAAEHYVNQTNLEKMLAPIMRQLNEIEKDLRERPRP